MKQFVEFNVGGYSHYTILPCEAMYLGRQIGKFSRMLVLVCHITCITSQGVTVSTQHL